MANGNLRQRIEGLLSGSSPLGNLGLGLLASSGPRPVGTSNFGSRLGEAMQFASQREKAAMQNQLMRDAMAQRKRQQQASQELAGLLGDTSVAQGPSRQVQGLEGESIGTIPGRQAMVPTVATQGGRQQALGLLAEANPQAVQQGMTQGLLGQIFPQQERSETSLVRNVRALQDPTLNEEQREIIRTNLEQDPQANDALLQRLDLQMRSLELAQAQREIAEEESSEREARANLIVDLRRDLKNTKRLAELNHRLRDTALETGVPMSDLRRAAASGAAALGRLIGVDTSEAQNMIADFDEFKKLSKDFAVQSAVRMFNRGDISNMQLQSVIDSSVGPSIAPETNDQILAKTLEELLGFADLAEVPLKDREELEALPETWRERRESLGGSPSRTSSPDRVVDWNDLPE